MPAPKINLRDYTYTLAESKIAKSPLHQRDQSKLLFYNKGTIDNNYFYDLPKLISNNSLLVFNDTKVIPARLFFKTATNAIIEVFLLQPLLPTPIINIAMQVTGSCVWKCMVGNLKKWKVNEHLIITIYLSEYKTNMQLQASWHDREKMEIKLSWDFEKINFSYLLKAIGEMPIPPYLNREATTNDSHQYQTVYAKHEGAVAAPTAGLHFTNKVLEQLLLKGTQRSEVTLHVSAGTFLPVKITDDVQKHTMHAEQIIVSKTTIEQLLKSIGNTIAVGTTSMRTLESLYWYGVKLFSHQDAPFFIEKLFCYETKLQNISIEQSLQNVLVYIQKNNTTHIQGSTEIIILPGYTFRICNSLITNFHQPDSTLILLIAAFIGEDWRTVYDYALQNEYRFLSYGDSSLLTP